MMLTLNDDEVTDAIRSYIESLGFEMLGNTLAWYPWNDEMTLEVEVKESNKEPQA